MPQHQVYGKRKHVYTKSSLFLSPVKIVVKEDVDCLAKVTEELGKLAVEDQKDVSKSKSRPRKALFKRNENRRAQPQIDKSVVKNESKRLGEVENEPLLEETPATTLEQPDTTKTPRQDSRDLTKTLQKDLAPQETKDAQSIDSPDEQLRQELLETTICHDQPPSNVFEIQAASLLNLSSRPLTSFMEWSSQISSHFKITKIAEASFGEVYRLSLLRTHHKLSKSDESVLKIIALKPPRSTISKRKMGKAAKGRLEMMSEPQDVAGEVRLMQRMTCIPGFTNFRDICVLQGRPGTGFVEAWHEWNGAQKDKGKESSVFPDPGKKASYSQQQLWAVIEMQDAGNDLENTKVGNVWTAWDVFWGVVLAIGKGEEGARFEHRDLHLGNICISYPKGKGLHTYLDKAEVDPKRKFGFTGIETTIIDYTISRAEMGDLDDVTTGRTQSDVAFFDLEKDTCIFEGDSEEEYQYDIYRYMRSALYLDEPLADIHARWDEATDTGRTWEGYHPQTNLVWLHFVLHKLMEQIEAHCKDDEAPCLDLDDVRQKRASELMDALRSVHEMLDPYQIPTSGLQSASDLVALALSEEWLDIEDVVGSNAEEAPTSRKKKGRKAGAKS